MGQTSCTGRHRTHQFQRNLEGDAARLRHIQLQLHAAFRGIQNLSSHCLASTVCTRGITTKTLCLPHLEHCALHLAVAACVVVPRAANGIHLRTPEHSTLTSVDKLADTSGLLLIGIPHLHMAPLLPGTSWSMQGTLWAVGISMHDMITLLIYRAHLVEEDDACLLCPRHLEQLAHLGRGFRGRRSSARQQL